MFLVLGLVSFMGSMSVDGEFIEHCVFVDGTGKYACFIEDNENKVIAAQELIVGLLEGSFFSDELGYDVTSVGHNQYMELRDRSTAGFSYRIDSGGDVVETVAYGDADLYYSAFPGDPHLMGRCSTAIMGGFTGGFLTGAAAGASIAQSTAAPPPVAVGIVIFGGVIGAVSGSCMASVQFCYDDAADEDIVAEDETEEPQDTAENTAEHEDTEEADPEEPQPEEEDSTPDPDSEESDIDFGIVDDSEDLGDPTEWLTDPGCPDENGSENNPTQAPEAPTGVIPNPQRINPALIAVPDWVMEMLWGYFERYGWVYGTQPMPVD